MDYKEKYEQALKRARDYYLTGKGEPVDFIKMIFPELQESEDERIRKDIISYLRNEKIVKKYISDIEIDKWIAWLEKQGNTSETSTEWSEDDKQIILSKMLRNK